VELAREAGRVKRGIGLPIVDAARERAVERQMLDRGRALGLADVYVHPVARALIDLARAAQEAEEEER
jgi:chorismate mutase